ncbi:MAG: hypothetical protein B7Z10_07400 [Rhodobacterales bacterium 32-66-7]|nr:MAG: hypothetical protein B7Z10_07400 [Rhodobacterales bacterium 32-66-7]
MCFGLGLAASEGVAQDDARFAALMAEVEADLAKAPEVDRGAEWWGAIGPSKAERRIANLLAKGGHFDDAVRIAKGIAKPSVRERALSDVGLAILWADSPEASKRLDRAGEVLVELRNPTVVTELVTEIAFWLIDQGEPSHALGTSVRAEGFAKLIGDESQKGEALWTIAGQYLSLGEIDRAQAVTDLIDDKFWKATVQSDVSFALAEAGDFVGAEKVVSEIDEEVFQTPSEAFERLAESLAAAGRLDEARRVVGRIAGAAEQMRALAKVAAVLAKADQATADVVFAEADALAMGIVDPDDQAAAFAALALSHVEAGRFDDAVALAAKLIATEASVSRISSGLEDIAQSLWEAGQETAAMRQIREAERFAALIEESEAQSSMFLNVARSYIDFGQNAEAGRVAATIEDAMYRVFAFNDTGVAFAQTGQIAEVTRLVSVIGEVEGAKQWRGSSLADIAKALAAAGEVAAAEAVAEGIVEPSWRANALGGITVALAEAGHLSEAERIARRIEDPAWRAVALGAVAAGL